MSWVRLVFISQSMPIQVARRGILLVCLAFGWGVAASGQGTQADYERARKLDELTRDKVLNAEVQVRFFGKGARFWYRRDVAPGQREFVVVEGATGRRERAFDHGLLAAALSTQLKKTIDPLQLPFAAIEFSKTGNEVQFSAGDKRWRFDLSDAALTEVSTAPAIKPSESRRQEIASPDGKWIASVRDYNLRIKPTIGEGEIQLSREGNADDSYIPEVTWSPDSRKLVAFRTTKPQDHKVYYVESSPADQLQPKLESIDYLKPGDRIPQRKPHLFDVERRIEIPVSDALFANPWENDSLHWDADSKRFLFVYNQRGHQVMRVVAVDAESGTAKAVVEEACATFFDYAHKQFVEYLDPTHEVIWMSEREGWNHLFLFDSIHGEVKSLLTPGEWVVRKVEHVDPEKRQIWFRAGGIKSGEDPYFVNECRVNFDGTGLVILTQGNGSHDTTWSPDRSVFVDRWSRVNQAPVTELRRGDTGALIVTLEKADTAALAATGWHAPEAFVAKGRDGVTDIHGLIHRPMKFDPQKKYPVLECIYAGPQDSYVPKEWRRVHRCQEMAELGFVVVQIDGMGTSNRSKKFHDVCFKNLGDAGFPDRILWMRAAAAKYSSLDVSRVGVYGGSAGGQNAMRALLDHGDFYKAAAADCGCHDNRMDKIWWNELWMSWPVGPQYEEASNVVQAHKLQGKLMLLVGEMDRNVDPASTLQVANALIRADKDFDLVVIPGGGHGSGGGDYGKRRQMDFFVRHLMGVEPRAR